MSTKNMVNRGKTALITGASSGFGTEFARLFAADGYNLVLVARREDKLRQIATQLEARHGVTVRVVPKDLSEPAAPQEIFDTLQQESITIDALVNNAGFATYGPFAEITMQAEMEMVKVNVLALTALTKLFLPGMLQRGAGQILNVASTAAFQPGPLMAAYYATKAYVLFLSEAIAEEVRASGITVTCLCPGPSQTGFQQRAAMEESRLVKGRQIMDARTVARAGYRGLQARKRVVIPGRMNQIMALTPRFAPRQVATRLVMRMQERTTH